MKKINVIGLGYIGLPTSLMMAASGLRVVGTDVNEEVVKTLKSGCLTFSEKGLLDLFNKAVKGGIGFSQKYEKADIYIVAVPTPYLKESKQIDPKYVIDAVSSVLNVCEENAIIVIESTVSPGTVDKHIRPLIDDGKFNVHLVHAPERILPGDMISELVNNSRTIGCDDKKIGEEIKEIYSKFCKAEIVVTDIKTAEMTKVVENTYRDINIAFANELTQICDANQMDVYEIIRIANKHPRVNILNPGPGVGGHCISVDPWFLVGDYPGLTNLILTARKTNDSMPEFVLKRVRAIMDKEGVTDSKRVGLYGLSYKEDVDDVRESPTLQLLELLDKHLSDGMKVFDPFIKNKIVKNQYLSFEKFLAEVDMVVIMVAHTHIKENIERLDGKIIFDTKNAITGNGIYKL